MNVTCPSPECGHQFQVLDPDSRRFAEQVMHDCVFFLKQLDAATELLRNLVGEAARLDANLNIPREFWNAYRAADDFLANKEPGQNIIAWKPA